MNNQPIPDDTPIAETLWDEFLSDMFDHEIDLFHEAVYVSGDESRAQIFLFVWMLDYQSGAELSGETQAYLENKMTELVNEAKEETAKLFL
jgi:hypothetical protein